MIEEEDENINHNQIKIVICGDVKVGKTCLLARFTDKDFLENPLSTSSDFIQKKIERQNKTYELNIWDTAGQEKFQSLNKIFFKGAQIAILVYDITNKFSFDRLKSFWYNEIITYSNVNTIIGIAGNKSDLYINEEVNEINARDYANSINATFRLTSALENKGIDDLFNETINTFLGIIPKPNKKFNIHNTNMIQSFSLNKSKRRKKNNEIEENNKKKNNNNNSETKCC